MDLDQSVSSASAIGLAATGERFRSIRDGGDHEAAN